MGCIFLHGTCKQIRKRRTSMGSVLKSLRPHLRKIPGVFKNNMHITDPYLCKIKTGLYLFNRSITIRFKFIEKIIKPVGYKIPGLEGKLFYLVCPNNLLKLKC